MRNRTILAIAQLAAMLATAAAPIIGQVARADENERAPIEYSRSEPHNRVSELQARLSSGKSKLEFDERHGYLPALLDALAVSRDSQLLVFSKTSLQRHRISPRTPRAIYFSDDVYVGFCQAGEVLEISAVDARLGAVFYTLDQKAAQSPQLQRQTDNCLICHSSSRTEGVPGHVVRSLFVDSSGLPMLSAGSYSVDHRTPLEHRWGGWYVTGTHGAQKHLGNLIVRGAEPARPIDNTQGHNVTDLSDRFAVESYLTPHSDLIALMVLEHQTLVQNQLTRASYTARQALHYQQELNRQLGEPVDQRLESTTRRIESAGDDLVDALLFVDEAPLIAGLLGTTDYASNFSKAGPRDAQGRSLRDLDLQTRLFKYPCSYLIYSPAFDQLPQEMRDYVWRKLWTVLHDTADARFKHLSADDRRAILDILRATKPELPDYWTAIAGS